MRKMGGTSTCIYRSSKSITRIKLRRTQGLKLLAFLLREQTENANRHKELLQVHQIKKTVFLVGGLVASI